MLLIAESELSSIMNSESSAALGHHQSHDMLRSEHEDPEMFTARTYAATNSPNNEFHQSPSAQSPPMTAAVTPEGQLQQHHINHYPEMVLQQQHHHQHQQQPISPHHQWDINDTVLPVPKVHDPFCLWPTGHCRRTYRGDSDDARRHVSGWAMRNTNNHNALILKKSCLGVLVCSRDCMLDNGRKVHLRPAICDKARRKQLAKPCPNPSCPGRLELLACRGHCGYPVTHFWRHLNGAVYFQAKGYHDHPRPDVKSLSDKGRNTFNKQIKHEGSRMLSLASKRRFPILTNEAIPVAKRTNQTHDEVMCSCPPFECVCPKSAKKEQLLQQQQQQQNFHHQQYQFTNVPHDYLTEPQPAQHPCGSTRTVMSGTDQGYPQGPVPHHQPPPFTQINITNTCLPPTASLDLNIPSVEIVAGCFSSNAQLHIPDQHHYNSLQNYAFQQHKVQYDYSQPNYHQSENNYKASENMGKAKHFRQGCTKSDEKRRKLDDISKVGDKDTAQFSCKFPPTESRPDSCVSQESQLHNAIHQQQEFQSVNDRNGAELIYGELPNSQISCDFDKTAMAQNFKSREESLVKAEKAATANNTGADDIGQADRLSNRLLASDIDTRNNFQVIPETQYEAPVSDSSFLYDTISTVFGADQRRASDQRNPGLVSPSQQAKGDDGQNKRPKDNSQSTPHIYNFLEAYTAPNQTQGPSPPIYTELTSPQRQNMSHQHDGFSNSVHDPQFYQCRIDGAANTQAQHQQLQQQQYHPQHYHHHNHQTQHQQVENSPSHNNPTDSFSPSLSQSSIVANPETSHENQYNMYNHASSENSHLYHSTTPLSYTPYSSVTPHPHYNDYSSLPLNGDGNMAYSYPCSDSAFSPSTASQQAYRNRSINITLTYN